MNRPIRRGVILCAGRGERMRPLTDHTPKPLLTVAGKPLVVHHLERLASWGIEQVLINTCHLGEQFPARLGCGQRWGVTITYQHEQPALETAGALARAQPWLAGEPFVLLNGDVWLQGALQGWIAQGLAGQDLGHLLLVDNPSHHPAGDFGLLNGRIGHDGPRYTYAGVALMDPALVAGALPDQPAPLRPWLQQALQAGRLAGTHHAAGWCDVGTPERLAALNASFG